MKSFLYTLIIILLSATLYSQGVSVKPGGHCYTMEIPDSFVKTYSLNDVATLQYQDLKNTAFIITIEDPKDHLENVGMKFNDAKDFVETFVKSYMKDAENRKVGPTTEFTINGNSHAQLELNWTDDKTDFWMLITSVETKTHYYKILCWTTAENKNLLKNDFIKVAKSLKD